MRLSAAQCNKGAPQPIHLVLLCDLLACTCGEEVSISNDLAGWPLAEQVPAVFRAFPRKSFSLKTVYLPDVSARFRAFRAFPRFSAVFRDFLRFSAEMIFDEDKWLS